MNSLLIFGTLAVVSMLAFFGFKVYENQQSKEHDKETAKQSHILISSLIDEFYKVVEIMTVVYHKPELSDSIQATFKSEYDAFLRQHSWNDAIDHHYINEYFPATQRIMECYYTSDNLAKLTSIKLDLQNDKDANN